MALFELPRITIARQRRVHRVLAEALRDKVFVKSLHELARKAPAEAVGAGEGFSEEHVLPPLLVDNTTDTVMLAFEGVLEQTERALTDRVVKPLPPERASKKAAASTLRQRLFPDGATAFTSETMSLQYDAMARVVGLLRNDAECVAAVRELGLGYMVDHLEAHLVPYGRAVKTQDGRDLEALGAAFHVAFAKLALAAEAHHGGDADVRKRLLAAYEAELESQREDDRDARARRARKKAEPKTG